MPTDPCQTQVSCHPYAHRQPPGVSTRLARVQLDLRLCTACRLHLRPFCTSVVTPRRHCFFSSLTSQPPSRTLPPPSSPRSFPIYYNHPPVLFLPPNQILHVSSYGFGRFTQSSSPSFFFFIFPALPACPCGASKPKSKERASKSKNKKCSSFPPPPHPPARHQRLRQRQDKAPPPP